MENVDSSRAGVLNRIQYKSLLKAMKKGLTDPCYISSISGGGPVEEFERAFAESSGGKYALALSSCTAALHTALMAYGIGPGDEVIVTPYSWGQSVAPVLFNGATAVFADIDPKTTTIDPNCIEERISNKTKAIIPVHIFGIPADIDAICSIAEDHEIAVISDAAQAYGALSKGRKIGSLGDTKCFSLGRGKAVCGGEGGVLVTADEDLYKRAVAITQHPLRASREVFSDLVPFQDELGWNYRIHPIAAVIALSDLATAEKRIVQRRSLLKSIHKKIESIPGIDPVTCYPGDTSAANKIPLNYNPIEAGTRTREDFIDKQQSRGIHVQAGPIHVPIHLRRTFHSGNKSWLRPVSHPSHRKGSCPVAENRCELTELELLPE